MSLLIVRHLLTGLLSLALAMPVSVWHVCRCVRAENAVSAKTADAPAARPCCAKRMAAAAAKTADQSSPRVRAKCCCSDLQWNQAITQVPPTRGAESKLISAALIENLPVAELRPAGGRTADSVALAPAAPDDPLQISLCRWQV